jgi:hypothetical protein
MIATKKNISTSHYGSVISLAKLQTIEGKVWTYEDIKFWEKLCK